MEITKDYTNYNIVWYRKEFTPAIITCVWHPRKDREENKNSFIVGKKGTLSGMP